MVQVEFNVKYGKNVINIPIEEYIKSQSGMTNLFNKTCTIYNIIPGTPSLAQRYDKKEMRFCSVQGGFVDKAQGTVRNVVNAKTVITQDVDRYIDFDKYIKLPIDTAENFFTAQPGDFIVFDDVDDVVTTAQEFSALKQKYKNNGILVTTISPYINGMGIDNVMFTNA